MELLFKFVISILLHMCTLN